MWLMRIVHRLAAVGLVVICALGLGLSISAEAQTKKPEVQSKKARAASQKREAINRGTVGIIAGEYGHLSLRLASDLANVLDEGDKLRIVAMAGRGSLSSMADMLYLRGIDLSIVSADVLDYAIRKDLFPNLRQKLRFVSRLYIQDVHLLAGPGIRSLADLNGKTVNVVSKYHGAFVTAQNLFATAGIKYQPVFFDQRLALDKIRRGEIAATLIVSGRPNPLLSEVKANTGLHLVPIEFSTKLPKVYVPSKLVDGDYPNLVPPGQAVPTIGTTAVMLVFNFQRGTLRHAKVARFIDAFLSRFDELQQPPRHTRWRDVNLGSAVAGWKRFGPVAEWLKSNTPQPVAVRRAPVKKKKKKKQKQNLKELFTSFINEEVGAGRGEQLLRLGKEELFARFLDWQNQQRGAPVKKKKKAKRSLKALFREFIDDEVGRVGQDKVRALSQTELYARFLAWRRKTTALSAQ